MNLLELCGCVVGLVYLWLEYKASIWLWLAGIIMPALYIWIYYDSGLYADMGINIYYLLASIYGWAAWKFGKGTSGDKGTDITGFPIRLLPAYLAATAVFTYIIWLILTNFTDSTVPIADSFTTALSIIGMWMLSKKYAEQWLAWILVDVVSCVLYWYKDLYFTSALYGLYALIAVGGYLKWRKMAARK